MSNWILRVTEDYLPPVYEQLQKALLARDVLHADEKAGGKVLPYVLCPRRAGDIAVCYCDASKAKSELGWQAQKTLGDMCAD